ncbi:MAG: xanthine dehydrogenase family protein subunit M, partial [Armatimonadota bacterium]|nr:xanthine dehydrogenase family protein subunit M [Armatimonadota bacterium]
ITSFFTGPFATALRGDEVLTEVRVPVPLPRSGGAYLKLERKVGDFATAAVAVQVALDPAGTCVHAGVGLTNAGTVPIKARRAEGFLRGKPLDDATVRRAGELAAEEADPVDDVRGSAAYKRDLVRVLTARALRLAAGRAGAGR